MSFKHNSVVWGGGGRDSILVVVIKYRNLFSGTFGTFTDGSYMVNRSTMQLVKLYPINHGHGATSWFTEVEITCSVEGSKFGAKMIENFIQSVIGKSIGANLLLRSSMADE